MNHQATLELTPAAPLPADTVDGTGFQIGWDHAHHGLVPPPELLLDGTPLGQGWRAGKAVFGRRTLSSTRTTRQWLALRTLAWRLGIAFETQQVTAHYVAQLQTARCPVTRAALGGADGEPTSAVIDRLNPRAGYAAGNLALLSQQAVSARHEVDVLEAMRRARRATSSGEPVEGLDASAWWRLAALRAFATPLHFHEAARLPLAVLPPNRVRLLNAAQGLQALLTLQFLSPGWSARTRELAAMLPEHTLRHDFNLFIGAIAPRVIEAGSDGMRLRHALEDAWLNERVLRRWQHFVLALGEAGCTSLLERATAAGLTGVRTLTHEPEQATEGWALPQGGRVARMQDAQSHVLWRQTASERRVRTWR